MENSTRLRLLWSRVKIGCPTVTNNTSLPNEGRRHYQDAIGCLMLETRPDLAFSMNKLAQCCAALRE